MIVVKSVVYPENTVSVNFNGPVNCSLEQFGNLPEVLEAEDKLLTLDLLKSPCIDSYKRMRDEIRRDRLTAHDKEFLYFMELQVQLSIQENPMGKTFKGCPVEVLMYRNRKVSL